MAPVIVAGESFRNIDLQEFGALPGTLFEQGSLQLFHLGPDLVIGAQLYLVNETRSLSFDEKLSEYQNAASTQLESVWWLPSPECATTLVLSNTSDQEVSTQAVLQMGKDRAQEVGFTLRPHETKVINLKQEKSVNKPKLKNQVGSASVRYSGPKGAVVARTLVEDSSSGYSFSAQFYSPQAGKSSGYQGVGLRLGTVAGEKLSLVVVARNIAEVETYLTGRMPFTTVDGRDGMVELPRVKLAAGEAQSLDLEKVIRKAIGSEPLSTASLEFEYSTAPGSVLMVAQSVSENGNQVFRVPMWDVPAQRNGTGGYPWFIEGDSSTFVYIKNVTNDEQTFTFSLTYDGGDYSLGAKKIKPRQTVVLDLRSLRDNQVPDERDQTIPVSATRGKLVWSVRGRNPLALLGRSEQVDLTKGISSSYACFMCCPNSFRFSNISPGSLGLPITNFTTVRGQQRDQTCYGSLGPWYFFGDTWSSDNSNIASINGSGDAADVTATGVGSTTLTGSWEVFHFTMEHDLDGPYCVEESEMTEPSAPVTVMGVQKLQYQSGANFEDIAGTLYVLKGSSVTFKALPNPANATWPSGQPVWSGTSGATGTGPTVSVTFSQASSSANDFKTVIATHGAPVTANVVVYDLTAVFTPENNFSGRSLGSFGVEELVTLGFTATPSVTASQAGGLRWRIVTTGTGNGTLSASANDDGTGTYNAPDTAKAITLAITVVAGPSKDREKSVDITIVEPTGGTISAPGNGIKHTNNSWSCGFIGDIRLTPTNVSFYNMLFYEGAAPAVSSGWLQGFAQAHAQSASSVRVESTGRVQESDEIFSGVKFGPYAVGEWYWDIPWRMVTNTSGRDFQITVARQLATSDNNGQCVISKGGLSKSRVPADPTSNW